MPNTTGKIKILYIITQSGFGGAQKYMADLTRGLNKDKYDIAVAAGGNGALFKIAEEAGIKSFRLQYLRRGYFNPIADIFGVFEIIRLIKKERPNVVHLNSSKAGFSGSIAAKLIKPYPLGESRSAGRVEGWRPKVVYTVHGAVFEAAFSWLTRKFFLLLEKLSAPFKDKIICVSENDRRLWLKYNVAPAKKLTVIHNGINLNVDFAEKEAAREKLFENIPPTPLQKREEKKYFERPSLDSPPFDSSNLNPPFAKGGKGGFIPKNKSEKMFLIGSIGYFYPEKNYAALIEAAALIKKSPIAEQNNIIFLINGDGQQRPLLESLIKQHGLKNTFFLPGAVAAASKYLKAFDIFVLPSVKEGLPYTILEAMAAGVPVVATNVGGIPEMIDDTKNGFLVAPRDANALAEKITFLLQNPALAEKFAAAAKEKVKEFSLEKMINKTEKIYSEVTKQTS